MSTKDIKIFKLKARGDGGSGRTELLTLFAATCRQFGMTAVLAVDKDEHLIVTSTKAQREKLWKHNRDRS